MSWSYDKSQQTPILATLENTVEKQKQAIFALNKEVTDMDEIIRLQQARIQRLNSENETLNQENKQLHNQVKVLTVLQSQLSQLQTVYNDLQDNLTPSSND